LQLTGASGTVARTTSAYDKEVSDSLCVTSSRYDSRQRLDAMLETEWAQLLGKMDGTRGSNTRDSSPLSILVLCEITPEQTIRMAGLDFGSSYILAEFAHLSTYLLASNFLVPLKRRS
jgi:hypothetical protein